MNRAVIARRCLVAAGAVVTEGKQFPDHSLILGVPAKAVRQLSENELLNLPANASDCAASSTRRCSSACHETGRKERSFKFALRDLGEARTSQV
jgi:carbonic anhydrase/acetyltransferase-like protein (isoleucine patch superfamily)